MQSNVLIGNNVGYALAEKTVCTVYHTCRVYADSLFIGKVYGPSNNPSQYKSYVHLDHLWNVRVITDSSGTVKLTITYEPFGKVWSTSGTWKSNVKYLQKVRDETTEHLEMIHYYAKVENISHTHRVPGEAP